MPTMTGTPISSAEIIRLGAAGTGRPARLLLRIDADDRVGMGHAVRTAALLGEIARPVELTVVGSGALKKIFPEAEIHGDDGAVDRVAKIAAAANPDAILVDVPRHSPELWRALRSRGKPVIAIDDIGGSVAADLIINGTVLEAYHRYSALPPNARVLAGPRYTLIRPAFAATPWRDPDEASVAIVIGSAERARLWAFMLAGSGLDRSGWGKVTMVVGGAFADPEGLRRLCDRAGIELRQGLDATALAELFAGTAVALITGGMVVYEALAVGAPAVIFPQIDNLVPEAAWFANHDCVRDLGYAGGMEPVRVTDAVNGLLGNPMARRAMSKRARGTIDGQGMKRAAEAIAALLWGMQG